MLHALKDYRPGRPAPARLAGGAGAVCRALLLVTLLGVACGLFGCASTKASLEAPELPPRHWLEDSPGVPVENREKLDSAVENLYDPDKVLSFEDCVFLTIQQSPMLVNSAVDLEMKRLKLTDAVWQYLPEPRMSVTVSANLTRHNEAQHDIPGDYGRTVTRVGFYATLPNPVASYFNHQVQKVMTNLAISTHRKAIGSAIRDIAETYLTIAAQEKIIAAEEKLIPLHKERINYWRNVENVEGNQGTAVNIAQQQLHEAELRVERSRMRSTMLLTKLKILAGVPTHQKLRIDTRDTRNILGDFQGRKHSWEQRWLATEDKLLVQAQVRLQDYNIMLAWAQYIPDVRMEINTSPPGGQAQPLSGQEDQFFHLRFDFPLLDWGRRYRGVQTARMAKAKAFQEQAGKRTDYSNKWLEAQQNYDLSTTSLKIAQSKLEVARMALTEAGIAFREGVLPYPEFATGQENLINAEIACINAELDANLKSLYWMHLANLLPERFLGLPAKEI